MKVVTGGAGMIGSAIAQALNQAGHEDVLIVDDLTDGIKFRNISGLAIADYQDKDDFLAKLENDCELGLTAVFHQGACSSTTEWDGRYMMRENYSYSKVLLSYCQRRRIPVVYASSAAVYGGCDRFAEAPENEHPLNVYGYSKKLLDDHVRGSILSRPDHAPVVGLRYFNVYGPREDHKGSMASVAFHLVKQLENGDNPRLFGAHDGYGPGEQCRDFVHVDDVAAVALWCWNSGISGIYNCGTGRAESFRTVAETVIAASGTGTIEYVAFPDHLKRHYQSFTQADMSRLQAAGYNGAFRDVATGVREYVEWLQKRPSW